MGGLVVSGRGESKEKQSPSAIGPYLPESRRYTVGVEVGIDTHHRGVFNHRVV